MTFEISVAHSSSLRTELFSGRAVLVHPEGDLYDCQPAARGSLSPAAGSPWFWQKGATR